MPTLHLPFQIASLIVPVGRMNPDTCPTPGPIISKTRSWTVAIISLREQNAGTSKRPRVPRPLTRRVRPLGTVAVVAISFPFALGGEGLSKRRFRKGRGGVSLIIIYGGVRSFRDAGGEGLTGLPVRSTTIETPALRLGPASGGWSGRMVSIRRHVIIEQGTHAIGSKILTLEERFTREHPFGNPVARGSGVSNLHVSHSRLRGSKRVLNDLVDSIHVCNDLAHLDWKR